MSDPLGARAGRFGARPSAPALDAAAVERCGLASQVGLGVLQPELNLDAVGLVALAEGA